MKEENHLALHVSMTKASVGALQPKKTYFSKTGLLKIQNLEHKYGAIKTQHPRK
jgi:hypothetical protein